MAVVRNCYMIFPERLEKGQSPPTKSLKLSVWTLHKERHVGREKYTEQKGWGGKQDTGRARPKRHHTDSWMSYRRDNQHPRMTQVREEKPVQSAPTLTTSNPGPEETVSSEIRLDQMLLSSIHPSLSLLPYSQKAD